MFSFWGFLKPKRVIVYGDIHGCLERLKSLREKIGIQKTDIEICVGDIINKGSQSLQTIKFLKDHHILSVLGNNEAKFLKAKKSKKDYENLSKDEKELFLKLGDFEFSFLNSLPLFKRFNNLVVLHAGLENTTNLNNLSPKDKENILSMRTIENSKNIFWYEIYNANQGFVVFGHQKSSSPIIAPNALGIDTGCVYGGKLTAAIFTDTKKIKYTLMEL